MVFYDSYVLPEEIMQMERKPHHSKYELIRTDEKCKEFTTNVVKQVYVLRQQEFKAKFPNVLDRQNLLTK